MAYGFLKDENSLQETHKVEDLFDFSKQLAKLKSRLGSTNHHVVIGLLGDYGTGKSTLLYQLEKEYDPANFIHIDLWRFPERTNLWKNFLYEVTLHFESERAFEKIKKITEAKQANTSAGVSLNIPLVSVEAGITDTHLEQDAIFQIQQAVIKLLKDKEVVIVIEDVDRSHEHGAYFLETLKLFIQDNSEELGNDSGLKVLIPMHPREFNTGEYRHSYQKSIDFTWDFTGIPNSYINFIKEYFAEELTSDVNRISLLSDLLIEYSRKMGLSIRAIKRLLKQANERYRELTKDIPEIDWGIVIMTELMRDDKSEDGAKSQYERTRLNRKILKEQMYNAFLESLRLGSPTMRRAGGLSSADRFYSLIDFTTLKPENTSPHIPFLSDFTYSEKVESEYKLSDAYFKDS